MAEGRGVKERLEAWLGKRPTPAEVVEKGVIPRSVIDAGKATWQVSPRKGNAMKTGGRSCSSWGRECVSLARN